ncbi:hypothetical protein PTTG_25794 [Puccinia triticina 1-1 BBBD Race 1]|uniref:Uncharacterized protein n=1 Tax=Puccinia triticina (isolate 1-1 / race 1 (BBBD)) TaxID=630390 RepID=A0A180H163_PUCT1|nr:hypothetical protein PTTG_25794 [Puccinia triticina 1-1 BBBD Race 1]WAR59062.1 hypothetical protein PtB15_10B404 [Puccinia triticina]
MGLFSRLRVPSTRLADEVTSPPPSPSQVTPPTLHHHLKRPTRLLRSENLEFQELLRAEPARVGLSSGDNNQLKIVSRLALKWKNRHKGVSSPADTSRNNDLTPQRSLPMPISPPNPVPGANSKSVSHSSRTTAETPRREKTAKPRGESTAALTPKDKDTSSPLVSRQRSFPQISRPSLLPDDTKNKQFSLYYPLRQHPDDTRVDMDFSVLSSISERDSAENRQLSYTSSTQDLVKFYQEVNGYNRKRPLLAL